ncbi:hypothetical protein K0M31_012988 [Melipona bicolor]|uniref:Uncharacterized protein n=1 Tax=Melipona bicolor TaxID=60889 RepID=A0AA40FIY0_9HYME|nr:hypothetical protein K0M31_012988 [Melipona bicolor]
MDKNADGWMDGWIGRRGKSVEDERQREMRRGDRVENRDADVTEWLVWPTSAHTHNRRLEETICWRGRQRATRRSTPHLLAAVYVQAAEGRPFKEDPENVKDKEETS